MMHLINMHTDTREPCECQMNDSERMAIPRIHQINIQTNTSEFHEYKLYYNKS